MQNYAIHATFERNKPVKADLDRFRCFQGKAEVISPVPAGCNAAR